MDIKLYVVLLYVNKYLIGILNLWIVLPTKYTKLFVQQIKMILQYRNYYDDTCLWCELLLHFLYIVYK